MVVICAADEVLLPPQVTPEARAAVRDHLAQIDLSILGGEDDPQPILTVAE